MGLLSDRRPAGRRIALAADGGGHTVVASDLVIAQGLELPALSDATRAGSPPRSRRHATLVNPVDFAGRRRAGHHELRERDRRPPRARARSTPCSSPATSEATRSTRTTFEREGERRRPRAWPGGRGHRGAAPRAHDVLALGRRPRPCARTACPSTARSRRRLASRRGWRAGRRRRCSACRRCRRPAAPVDGRARLLRLARAPRRRRRPVRRGAAGRGPRGGARRRGEDRLPDRRSRRSGELHKSDSGGVAVGLRGPEELDEAFDRMERRALAAVVLGRGAWRRCSRGLELIVGAKRDPRFGPILLVGAGGLYAEIVKDVAVALAPVDGGGRRGAASARFGSRRSWTARAAGRRWTWAPPPRRPRRSRVSRPSIRRSPRSRSTRCSRSPTAPSASTRVSSWARCSLRAHSRARSRSSPAAAAAWAGRSRSSWGGSARPCAVAGRRPEPLDETVALLARPGLAVPTDVRDPEAVDALVAATVEAIRPGGRPRQQRRRQLRRQGGGPLPERLARGRLHRPRRRLPLLARGREADDRAGRRRLRSSA